MKFGEVFAHAHNHDIFWGYQLAFGEYDFFPVSAYSAYSHLHSLAIAYRVHSKICQKINLCTNQNVPRTIIFDPDHDRLTKQITIYDVC